MTVKLRAILIFQQRIIQEKYLDPKRIVLADQADADFRITAFSRDAYLLFEDGKVFLPPGALASFSMGDKTQRAQAMGPEPTGEDHALAFKEGDWLILNLGLHLDFVLFYDNSPAVPPFFAASVTRLGQSLESPIARAILASFVLHSVALLLAFWHAETTDPMAYKPLEARWIEMLSSVPEHKEVDDKEEELPIAEDPDDLIIDDALVDTLRPKIDDTQSPVANLDKIKNPIGLQAALGSSKVHDMETLFGSAQNLGNALDGMPETLDGDAYGMGAGFSAGLAGFGVNGGGGGGGGRGGGIGNLGGGGSGGGGGQKISGPKRAAAKVKPKLDLAKPEQGAFCREQNIRDVVQKRANALRNCYEQQLLADPNLSGKIVVFWKIGLDGKVTEANIKSTTMKNEGVEACLVRTVRRLNFDPPEGGICVVEFPFIFTSAS